MRRFVSLVVLLTILMAPRASAQLLRGVVHDSTAGHPLAGAIVQVLDSAGRPGARSITDADGRFVVTVSSAAARLRVLRIGYRPSETVLPGNRTVPVEIRLGHLPPILDVMRVTGRELCPGSPERGAAFEIWQQARTGLLATIVARDLKPAQATTMTYTTHLSPNDMRVRLQTKAVVKGSTTRPFMASAAPSFFARVGYMIEDGPTRIFNAPDADVLIDQSFATTHCFRLRRADAAHPGQVGVAFAPIGGRDTLVEVEGVIWVDAATPQLRSLDFTFTSLEPAAMDADAGGHVEFRTMSNGVSFIDRWNLRLAGLQPPPPGVHHNAAPGTKVRRTDLSELRLRELVDAGGVVLTASWPDGTRFDAVKSSVSGVVVGKGNGEPVRGAIVSLTGTPDTVKTDSAGHFQIETLPGKYLLQATDTTLGTFAEPRSQSMPVEIRLGADATARLEVTPWVIDCHGQPAASLGSGLIVGAVAMNAGELPRNAFVEATFQHIRDTDFITTRRQISLDDGGRFVVCGTPLDRKVHLSLQTSKGAIADTSVVVRLDERTHQVLWVVSRP